MALPADLVLVTLTAGPIVDGSGEEVAGYIEADCESNLVYVDPDDLDTQIIVGRRFAAKFAAGAPATLVVPATDHANIPDGLGKRAAYRVKVVIDSGETILRKRVLVRALDAPTLDLNLAVEARVTEGVVYVGLGGGTDPLLAARVDAVEDELVVVAADATAAAADASSALSLATTAASGMTGLDGRLDTVEATLIDVVLQDDLDPLAAADTALDGRLDAVEAALPGKADDADVTALDGRLDAVEAAASTFMPLTSRNYIDFDRDYAPASDVVSAVSAFAAAVAAAQSQDKLLVLRARRYYMPSVSTITGIDGLRFEGDGPENTILYHDGGDSYLLDLVGGSLSATSTLLTANAATGDLTLTVASTAGLTAGEWANIQSDEIWDATSGKNARTGELVRIKSVDSGTQVTLYTPLDYAYTTANSGRVAACPLTRGMTMRGIGFENTDPLTGTAGAVVFRNIEGLVVEDIMGVGLDGPLVSLTGCVDPSLLRVSGREMADDEPNDRYGYVINIGPATRGAVIAQGHAYKCRNYVTNATTANADIGGVPTHNTIIGCSGSACTNTVFSSHEEGDDTTYIGCKAHNTLDMGFHFRARRTKAYGNSVDGAKGTGVLVRASAPGTVIRGMDVLNLTGLASDRGNQTNAIILSGADAVLDGFRLEDIARSGVLVTGDRATIRNGVIKGFGQSASDPHAIRFSSSATKDHEISDVLIDGEGLSTRPMTAGAAGVVTGLRVRNVRARGVLGPPTNLSGLESILQAGTVASEWVINSAPERIALTGNHTMLGTSTFIAVSTTGIPRTITLPAISAVAPGVIYTVKDESGGAATNNITVQRAGSDTIEGGTSKVISTNYGVLRFYSNGAQWMILGKSDFALAADLVALDTRVDAAEADIIALDARVDILEAAKGGHIVYTQATTGASWVLAGGQQADSSRPRHFIGPDAPESTFPSYVARDGDMHTDV